MKRTFAFISVINVYALTGCATQQVSYQRDVVPILEQRCLECHVSPDGSGYQSTGLLLDSYESLMHGTDYGPVIIAGDSRRSIFNMLVEGRAGNMQRMPHNDDQGLSEEQIDILRNWVNQGALNN
jgi:hypothetical protein